MTSKRRKLHTIIPATIVIGELLDTQVRRNFPIASTKYLATDFQDYLPATELVGVKVLFDTKRLL